MQTANTIHEDFCHKGGNPWGVVSSSASIQRRMHMITSCDMRLASAITPLCSCLAGNSNTQGCRLYRMPGVGGILSLAPMIQNS